MFKDNSSERPRMDDVDIECIQISKKVVTANKNHDCAVGCRKRIKRGEKYTRTVWKVDGEIKVEKSGWHVHSYEED